MRKNNEYEPFCLESLTEFVCNFLCVPDHQNCSGFFLLYLTESFSTHFFWHRHWKKSIPITKFWLCQPYEERDPFLFFFRRKVKLYLLHNIIPSPLQQIGCMTCSSTMPRLCLCLCRLCSEEPRGLFHTGDRVHCSLADRNLQRPHIGHSWYIPKNILRMLVRCFLKLDLVLLRI
jgi:hypothetical protein